MPETFAASDLIAIITRHRPGAGESISLAPIRTGKFNTSFYVTCGTDEFVLRIAPPRTATFLFYERDMIRQEPGLHALLRERTGVPVARILAFDDSHEVIDRDYILMERLPGTALSDAPGVAVDPVLRQVGEALAAVHALTAERYGYLGEHRPMEPQATWAAAFQIMWRLLLADIRATGHYTDREVGWLTELLDRYLPVFDRPVPASLLHMDVWSQNILVDGESRLTGLVDWDRAVWGDPEIEFAVLDYCGISEPAFWEGYGRRREESAEARIRNVFYLLYEIQKYIVIRHGRSGDPAAARRHKEQAFQIARRYLDSE